MNLEKCVISAETGQQFVTLVATLQRNGCRWRAGGKSTKAEDSERWGNYGRDTALFLGFEPHESPNVLSYADMAFAFEERQGEVPFYTYYEFVAKFLGGLPIETPKKAPLKIKSLKIIINKKLSYDYLLKRP